MGRALDVISEYPHPYSPFYEMTLRIEAHKLTAALLGTSRDHCPLRSMDSIPGSHIHASKRNEGHLRASLVRETEDGIPWLFGRPVLEVAGVQRSFAQKQLL